MPTVYIWPGATTSTTARVRGKIVGVSARLVVSESSSFANAVFFGPDTAVNGIVSFDATGLDPRTDYYLALQIDGTDPSDIDTVFTGQVRTLPVEGEPSNFTLAAWSCQGLSPQHPGINAPLNSNRISNTPHYLDPRTHSPDQILQIGDLTYYDPGSGVHVADASVGTFRQMYDDMFNQPNWAEVARLGSLIHQGDDHEGGPDNHDRTFVDIGNYQQVYREIEPSYPLNVTANQFQAWRIARGQMILWDVRSDRDPNNTPAGPSKSMLGPGQRAAFEEVLESSTAEFLLIFSPSAWHGPGINDSWTNFADEQQWVISKLVEYGWSGRTVIVQGDQHACGIDTGTQSPGGIPVMQAAAMDSTPGAQSHFDLGPTANGRGQYGTVHVVDDGNSIDITLTTWTGLTATYTYTVVVNTPIPVPPDPEPVLEIASATVRSTVEWIACDLVSGDKIAYLPGTKGTVSRALGAYTSDTPTVPAPLFGNLAMGGLLGQSVGPDELPTRMLVAIVNDVPAWAGIIWKVRGGSSGTIELGCATPESYLDRRFIGDRVFSQVDQSTIVGQLVTDANVEGINLFIDAPPSGVLRDRSYFDDEDATYYQRLTELMDVEGGPEWTIDPEWHDDRQQSVRLRFKVRNRIGSTEIKGPFLTESSAVSSYAVTYDYGKDAGANDVLAYSSGEGADRPTSVHVRNDFAIAAGVPRIEHRWSPSSSIKSVAVLNSHASAGLSRLDGGTTSVEVTARWDVAPARLGIDLHLGDDIEYRLTGHMHPTGLLGTGRMVGFRLDTDSGTFQPTLRMV